MSVTRSQKSYQRSHAHYQTAPQIDQTWISTLCSLTCPPCFARNQILDQAHNHATRTALDSSAQGGSYIAALDPLPAYLMAAAAHASYCVSSTYAQHASCTGLEVPRQPIDGSMVAQRLSFTCIVCLGASHRSGDQLQTGQMSQSAPHHGNKWLCYVNTCAALYRRLDGMQSVYIRYEPSV